MIPVKPYIQKILINVNFLVNSFIVILTAAMCNMNNCSHKIEDPRKKQLAWFSYSEWVKRGFVDISSSQPEVRRQVWKNFLVKKSTGWSVCVHCFSEFSLDLKKGRVAMGQEMAKHARYSHNPFTFEFGGFVN